MVDESKAKSYKWALFVRLGIVLSIGSLAFLLRALQISDWVITEGPGLTQTTSDLITAANTTDGNPFFAFGDVRGARFGVFDFCMKYEVPEWGNIAVPVCWPYAESLTLNGDTKKACDHIVGIDSDLCATSDRTIGCIFVALLILAAADIFSEKVAIQIIALFLSSIPISFVVLTSWIGFLFHLREADEWLVFEWGVGLNSFVYSQGAGIVCCIMITVALCCWHFDPEDEDNTNWFSFLTGYNPWHETDSRKVYRLGSVDTKHSERVKHEQLSGRQHFFRDNVGWLGRFGALLGLVSWALLLSATYVPDWIVLNQSNGTTITELKYYEGGTFGFQEYCLQREVRSLGQFNRKQFVCFPYDHEGSILEYNADGTTTTVAVEKIDTVFASFSIDFERRTVINMILFGGIFAAIVGDLYSEWTLFNGVALVICAIASLVAAVMTTLIVSAINDESADLTTTGTGYLLMVVATLTATLGAVFNMVDSCLHGQLKVWFGKNAKCYYCREAQSETTDVTELNI